MLATGALPRRLQDSELEGIHTLRTLEDALAIRRTLERGPRVAIVGAGFIGLEVAASCRALGLDVTLVELSKVPLGVVLGGAMGEAIADFHRSHGVRLLSGIGVTGFLGEKRVEGLVLGNGTKLAADLVVVGIGVVPESRLATRCAWSRAPWP